MPSEGTWPHQHLDLGVHSSRIVTQKVCAVLSHQFVQPWEMYTLRSRKGEKKVEKEVRGESRLMVGNKRMLRRPNTPLCAYVCVCVQMEGAHFDREISPL